MEKTIKINGKNHIIKKDDINSFRSQNGGGRGQNDRNNNTREKTIYALIEDYKPQSEKLIPEEWHVDEEMWRRINKGLYEYITIHFPEGIISLKYLAGRQHNCDFLINDKEEEFKFGGTSIIDHPQFLSLSADKLDSDKTYPEYFYDEGYVSTIHEVGNIEADIPTREDYLQWCCQSNYNINILI